MKSLLISCLAIVLLNNNAFASVQSSGPDGEDLVTCDLYRVKYSPDDRFHKNVENELINSIKFTRLGEDRTSLSPSIGWFNTNIDIGGMQTKGFNIAVFGTSRKNFLDTFAIKVSSEKGCEANNLYCVGERPILVTGDLSQVGSKINLRVFDYQVECRNATMPQVSK